MHVSLHEPIQLDAQVTGASLRIVIRPILGNTAGDGLFSFLIVLLLLPDQSWRGRKPLQWAFFFHHPQPNHKP